MEQSAEDEKIKDNKKFEAEKIYYEEATQRGINLSYSFYVTLGLYIAIIGGYLSLGRNHEKYVNFIGLIFFLLLFPLAKISRLQADNGDVHKKFRNRYESDVMFRGTGIKGVGDFFHYCILFGITSFFLLKPFFNDPIHSTVFISLFATVFIILVLVIYYIFAKGDFLFGEIKYSESEDVEGIKNQATEPEKVKDVLRRSRDRNIQYFFLGAMITLVIGYAFYWLMRI